jgi:hypothetical protein
MVRRITAAEDAMHWQERIDHYVQRTGFRRSLFLGTDGRAVGTWIMGNDYRVRSAYYGGYPAGYLRRIRALFPDKQRALHLFSGKVDRTAMPGDTVDINPALEPTYVDDAQTLEATILWWPIRPTASRTRSAIRPAWSSGTA